MPRKKRVQLDLFVESIDELQGLMEARKAMRSAVSKWYDAKKKAYATPDGWTVFEKLVGICEDQVKEWLTKDPKPEVEQPEEAA